MRTRVFLKTLVLIATMTTAMTRAQDAPEYEYADSDGGDAEGWGGGGGNPPQAQSTAPDSQQQQVVLFVDQASGLLTDGHGNYFQPAGVAPTNTHSANCTTCGKTQVTAPKPLPPPQKPEPCVHQHQVLRCPQCPTLVVNCPPVKVNCPPTQAPVINNCQVANCTACQQAQVAPAEPITSSVASDYNPVYVPREPVYEPAPVQQYYRPAPEPVYTQPTVTYIYPRTRVVLPTTEYIRPPQHYRPVPYYRPPPPQHGCGHHPHGYRCNRCGFGIRFGFRIGR